MESINVSLAGNSSSLTTNLNPEFELDRRFDYSCCLLDLSVQIPALTATLSDNKNDWLHYFHHHDGVYKHNIIKLTTGRRTLKEIAAEIEAKTGEIGHAVRFWFSEPSMKYHIHTDSAVQVDLRRSGTIANIFGFVPRTIYSNHSTEGDHALGGFDVNTIRINCDLVGGSFYNELNTHTIHEFYPKPLSNYKLIEQPHNLVYLPIVKQRISSINVTVTDQDGKQIDFERGTQINCRFHIKRTVKKC